MNFLVVLKRLLGPLGALLVLAGCHSRELRGSEPEKELPPRLTAAQVARLLPPGTEEPEGWGDDVLSALEAQRVFPSAEPVCEVLAVIEQESGFHANPVVKELPRIVRKRLDAYAGKLGVVGRKALEVLLEQRAPGQPLSFEARLRTVRTERDLDRLFRELLVAYERQYPAVYTAADFASELFTSRGLEELNPITTAGSMQVSVRFAVEHSQEHSKDERPEAEVREELYTRAGGVRYGTARLLGYEAAYAQPLYRFADYNAGAYSSRNAALQAQVSELMRLPLTKDGDLLLYDAQGEPRDEDSRSLAALLAFRARHVPELSERRVRRDVLLEKQARFEETDTWRAVKQTYERVLHKRPEYAQLPEVVIRSPKLSRERTTEWYARSVDQRFQRCMARYRDRGR
jgi:hypothetical protein